MRIDQNKELYNTILESINNPKIIEEENIQVDALAGYCDSDCFFLTDQAWRNIPESDSGEAFEDWGYGDVSPYYLGWFHWNTGCFPTGLGYSGSPYYYSGILYNDGSLPPFVSVKYTGPNFPIGDNFFGSEGSGVFFYIKVGQSLDADLYCTPPGSADVPHPYTITPHTCSGESLLYPGTYNVITYDIQNIDDELPYFSGTSNSAIISVCSGQINNDVITLNVLDEDCNKYFYFTIKEKSFYYDSNIDPFNNSYKRFFIANSGDFDTPEEVANEGIYLLYDHLRGTAPIEITIGVDTRNLLSDKDLPYGGNEIKRLNNVQGWMAATLQLFDTNMNPGQSFDIDLKVLNKSIGYMNQYNSITTIPEGLNISSSNYIVTSHIINRYDSNINIGANCGRSCEAYSTAPFYQSRTGPSITYIRSPYVGHSNDIAISIGAELTSLNNGSFISGIGTFYTNSRTSPTYGGLCCGVAAASRTEVINIDGSLEPFVTGIGEYIPFSGGINNVEWSYFEPLGSDRVILVPQASGSPLSSNDNSFFIYTHGNGSYIEVVHPTETGVLEVVGSAPWSTVDDYILCRYASDTSSVFVYTISTDTWSTAVNIPSYNINRIIKLDRDDGKYFIAASSSGISYNNSFQIYDVVQNTSTNVHNGTSYSLSLLGMPEDIAVIPNLIQDGCSFVEEQSKDMVKHTNKYHIFPLNADYSSGGSAGKYPIILDLNISAYGPQLKNKEFSISSDAFNRYYLHGYLNHKPDIAVVADKLVISLSATTGTGPETNSSRLIIRDNTTGQIFQNTSNTEKRRVTKLLNDQILWSSYSSSNASIVIDPFIFAEFNFPEALNASISVAASCGPEYRTLMLDSDGTKAYILNDLDRTYTSLSFTGSLPMGKYHDIFVFDQLDSSVKQSRNFYLMPTEIYETGFPSGNLAVLSTTTSGPTGITISGDFTINETVLYLEPIQTTTSRIEVGTFSVENSDDEFASSVIVGFDTARGDADIFEVEVVGNSGTIYVKEGTALDYETKSSYIAYITGIDPYVGGQPFVDSFTLQVLNVDERPSGITIDSSTVSINSNINTTTQVLLTNFEVLDPDGQNSLTNNNEITLTGPDKHIFSFSFSNTNQQGSLYLKAGTSFDTNIQDTFNVTILASQVGDTFTVSTDFILRVLSAPPSDIIISPTYYAINENYVVPINTKLADFRLVDSDQSDANFAVLTDGSDYFYITYNNQSGSLYLRAGSVFDYETQPSVLATISAGNILGEYSASTNFVVNVIDIYEPSGISVNPPVVYLDEDVDTSARSIKLADLSWNFASTENMVIYSLEYPEEGYLSATDLFAIVDNDTRTPELHLKQFAELDYETQHTYYVYISGRPASNTTDLYGGQLVLIVNDVDEPPIITFDPPALTIPENFDTSLGSFKAADIFVLDEELSTVSFSLIGDDREYFTLNINDDIIDNDTSTLVGNIYFNSGINLNFETKSSYTGIITATDSAGLVGTKSIIITLGDVVECDIVVSADIIDTPCPNSSLGSIFLDVSYTGTTEEIAICNTGSVLSVQWPQISSGTGLGGFVVNDLAPGTYRAIIYGGNIPRTGINYTVGTTSDLQLLQVIKENPSCQESGLLTVVWSGGVPPYSVSYGLSTAFIPSGSGYSAVLNVFDTISESPVIVDAVGCSVSGAVISFDFISNSSFVYESQSPPIIYNDTVESFMCTVSHGPGPYQVNLYSTTTGERGDLVRSFDRFDTSIINRIDQLADIIIDENGVESLRINNPNPDIYYYDFQNKIYPGIYLFEFINSDGCSIVSDPQTILNIEPLTADIFVANDDPFDVPLYTISQPILDTLFIPYKMLVNNSELLSYLSSIIEKSEIKLEIGGLLYNRKALYGSINCNTYSILNIKFLGVNDTDWFYTLPIYKGFDVTDTDIDILNENIYLVLPNGNKIKIVTELNNNVNTIKLLKGSILTNDYNVSQYKNNAKIGLFNYNLDSGEFVSMEAEASVIDTAYLYNKYLAGNTFRIDFLNNPTVSLDLSTSNISSLYNDFSCNDTINQQNILKYRKFMVALNSFGILDNIYSKAVDSVQHNGYISTNLTGGYPEYRFEYYYYDQSKKCLSELLYNNNKLTDQNANNLKNGVYILKITDAYGNKPYAVNATQYDDLYVSMIDFILNELKTNPSNLNFEYGDILINIANLLETTNPYPIPGAPEISPTSPPTLKPLVVIETSTYKLSPNENYQNSVTIQTNPGKISYIVNGPYGYSKKFDDRVILTQLPPGVYTIAGDDDSLRRNYLYQQNRRINVIDTTNILVDINFDSYQGDTVIRDICTTS